MSGTERPENRLRELRDARHLSVRDLAEKSGVDFNTVSRMERGAQALDIPRMRKLAAALNVKPSELLNDEDVELRANETGRALLEQLSTVSPEDQVLLAVAAGEVLKVARRMAAGQSAGALMGRAEHVAGLADVWNSWSDAERARGLELLRVSQRD